VQGCTAARNVATIILVSRLHVSARLTFLRYACCDHSFFAHLRAFSRSPVTDPCSLLLLALATSCRTVVCKGWRTWAREVRE